MSKAGVAGKAARRGDLAAGKGQRGGERPALRGYVNLKPSDSEKERFNEWYDDDSGRKAAFVRVVDSGWKITIACDSKPGVFVGSVSTWQAGHPSAGIILNTRGTDFLRTMFAVVWALEELYDYSLEGYLTGGSNPEDMF